MRKELISRVIQPTDNPVVSESLDPDDIHKRIRKGVEKFLSDAGYSNLEITMGPSGGCSHERCIFTATVNFSNIARDQVDEMCKTFHQCAQNAAIIVASEILGPRKILDSYITTTIIENS